MDGMPYQGVTQSQAGIFIHFDRLLYQGRLLQTRLHDPESQQAAASDVVQEASNQALRGVALAYSQLDTGLQQHDAPEALWTVAQSTFAAANDSYAHGVGTFADAFSTGAALAAARSDVVRAHAQSLINAAGLAFASRELNALLAGSRLRSGQ